MCKTNIELQFFYNYNMKNTNLTWTVTYMKNINLTWTTYYNKKII